MSNGSAPLWKQFELLVASIEAAASKHHGIVKSPDRLLDKASGKLREVDASIRFSIGTIPVLITIEVRFRRRPADITWIEQLSTKRQRLGATKTIAVSSSGFTEDAAKTAAQHGIEVRTLSAAKPEEIGKWFLETKVVHRMRGIDSIVVDLTLADGRIVRPVALDPCLSHPLVATRFPPALFGEILKLSSPELFDNIPKDGSQGTIDYSCNGDDRNIIPVPLGEPKPRYASLRYYDNTSFVDVKLIHVVMTLSYQLFPVDLNSGSHFQYSGSDTSIMYSSFEGTMFDLPVKFEHQSTADNDILSTFTFPSGVKFQSKQKRNISRVLREINICELDDDALKYSHLRLRFLDGSTLEGILLFTIARSFEELDLSRPARTNEYLMFLEIESIPRYLEIMSRGESAAIEALNANDGPVLAIVKSKVDQVLLLSLDA